MISDREPQRRLLRILCSETGEQYPEKFSPLIHQAAGDDICVAMLFPKTIYVGDLLDVAAKQRWDLGIFAINNILYGFGEIEFTVRLVAAGKFVRQMKKLFGKPLICLSGWDDEARVRRVMCESGADAFFPIPWRAEEAVPVLKYHFDNVRGL